MTVKELIAELSHLPASMEVRVPDESGDYRVPISGAQTKSSLDEDSYEVVCIVPGSVD